MTKIEEIQNYHFIGAGGVSVSALMKLLLKLGKRVSGSDRNFSDTLLELRELGADVWVGAMPQRIPRDALVVYSSAVKDNNEELVFARKEGMTAVERFVFLGEIEKRYAHEIAVAGTHGKTTVTSMLASIFLAADKKFTAHIGGTPVGLDNLIYRGDDWFLTEACEYKRSMCGLNPDYAIVLNAECDHPDTYKDLSDVYGSFDRFLSKRSVRHSFVEKSSSYGERYIPSHEHLHTFAIDDGDFCASGLKENEKGCYGFQIIENGNPIIQIDLQVPGIHNVKNALAAAAVSLVAGISAEAVKEGLEGFRGVKRRFEKTGTVNGADIIVDYAHHPSEIKATVGVAKKIAKGRLITVFQPHTYSRTAQLFTEFQSAFLGSDVLYLTKTYSAREKEDQGKTAYELYLAIKKNVMFCVYHENFLPLAEAICREARENDVVLLLGAGDVNLLSDLIKDDLGGE